MDFEPFAPVNFPGKKSEEPPELKLKKRIRELEEELGRVRNELENLKFAKAAEEKRYSEERKRLIEELNKAHQQLLELQSLVQQLSAENEDLRQQLELLNITCQKLEDKVGKTFEQQKEKILSLLLSVLAEALKIFLKKEEVFDEETLKRIFKEIFSEKIFTGEITVKGNPKDIELLREILSKKEKTLFDLIPDPNLHRGEIEVETEKFFVERKTDELVEELVEKLFREYLKKQKGKENSPA
jgi:flagellar biosynthesis/type III secretory pathway protein FliH